MESQKVADKLRELYRNILNDDIGIKVIKNDLEWLVFFEKDGHEEAFNLPGDFLRNCVEQGYCHDYRREITRAIGCLMEAVRAHGTSAALVVSTMRDLVPSLNDPTITIAVSEEDPYWVIFMTKKGATRPVEFRLPSEVVTQCVTAEGCAALKAASETAYRCLIGD